MNYLRLKPLHAIVRSKDGSTAVEFAILAPLYLLLLLGITAYGIYFGASHSIQQIAADAARTAIAGMDQAERQSLAAQFVGRNAGTYSFVRADAVRVEVRDNPQDAAQFVVTVIYDAEDLPIWGLLPALPLPRQTISRSSTIRIGGL